MRRRFRRHLPDPTNPYSAANNKIRSKELDVYYATVDAQFTMDDVVAWLFPEDVIRKLKDAYPLAHSTYHSNFSPPTLPLPSGDKVELCMDLDKVHMQCPLPKYAKPVLDGTAGQNIVGVLQAACDVNNQFDKVRKVISWLGAHNVTPGAAAYYWPTLLSLMPPESDVHKAGGTRYREVIGIGEILPLLRETAGIVAGAHLCPVAGEKSRGYMLQVTCRGDYPQMFTVL
jgi:hypothetical protein